MTRKITRALARIVAGTQDKLYLGNLDARRDWGHAKDHVRAMWMMLQQDSPDDFVIATGETHTAREFIEVAGRVAGFDLEWEGDGVDEIGRDARTGKTIITIDPAYYRPADVELLCGDASKAEAKLGWKPHVCFAELAELMMKADLDLLASS